MLRVLGTFAHLPSRTWAMARRRPRLALGLALVFALALALVAGVGVWGYGRHQWRAAQAAIREERPAEARERLEFCLRLWPRSPEVHLLAARAARQLSDFNTAETHLNRCLELQGGPTDEVRLEFLLMRVQAGELDGELSPLAALFDTVRKDHAESPLILETIARAFILRLRYKPAYDCISLWIHKQPDSAKAYQWRGWVLERLNNHKEATADYHRALERDPELIPVRLRIAEMLLEDKQAPEALPHLERLMRQAPNDPTIQARMGMCRYLQGQMDEARRLMEGAVVHIPKDPALLVSLANLDLQEGRGVEAERRLRTVLEMDQSDTEALFVLSSALQLQGRTEEAAVVIADYERKRVIVDRINNLLKDVADSRTAKGDDYAEIGQLFLQINRDKLGVYWSERALELDPGNQAAHLVLASHYHKKGDAAKERVHRQQIRVPVKPVPPSNSDPRGPGQ